MNNILIYIGAAVILLALLATAAEVQRELHSFKVTHSLSCNIPEAFRSEQTSDDSVPERSAQLEIRRKK